MESSDMDNERGQTVGGMCVCILREDIIKWLALISELIMCIIC